MQKKLLHLACAFLVLMLNSLPGHAATAAPVQLDGSQKQAVIEELSKVLRQYYVFPEASAKMSAHLQQRLKSGAYDSIADPGKFAQMLNDDLQAAHKDGHMDFSYSPDFADGIRRQESKDPAEVQKARDERRLQVARDNFGFRKVERLAGNVGYLDFRAFVPASVGGETAIAALGFLANCDAILIDLRQNGGGDPSMIQLISSYFFEDSVHLNDIFTPSENLTEHYWTLPFVPGKKMNKADLYILTSHNTYSAAEEFSYNMKSLKRATLVGETTGGGAHPSNHQIVMKDYVLSVPYARAINPITKTNWEGTGVTPDVSVPADKAYDEAYKLALETLAAKATKPQEKAAIEWNLKLLHAKAHPVKLSEATMKMYAGKYQDRKVTLENNELYYQRTGAKYKLLPLSETILKPEGLDDFGLEFIVKDNKAIQVNGITSDGQSDPSPRSE